MKLGDYVVGQNVEVLLLDAWHAAIVISPATASMSLIVDLVETPGTHVAVIDEDKIRPVAQAYLAPKPQTGARVTLRAGGSDAWSGTVSAVQKSGALVVKLD